MKQMSLCERGYAPDKKATQPQSTRRFAIHGDHLGTPQAITDDTQRVVWLARYDVFGRASAQGLPRSQITAQNRSRQGKSWIGSAQAAESPDKPFAFHLRFAGQYEDAETGWHYNWHRYYEPETGRYLTPDPIGLRGGVNAFGYANGDPLGAVDPWGLLTIFIGGAGDQSSFLGYGPTRIMGNHPELLGVADRFFVRLGSEGLDEEVMIIGYDNINSSLSRILEIVRNNPNEQINIVGHSRGGWNGAQLAAMLSRNCRVFTDGSRAPIVVENLITLDPVQSSLFFPGSPPFPTVNNWINIEATPAAPDFSDTIADTGGRWRNPNGANTNLQMNVNHGWANIMFTRPLTPGGQSAADQLIESIRSR